jgi:hypothetical protein
MQYLGDDRSNFAIGVETHLARGKDGGRTWHYVQTLLPKTPAKFLDSKTQRLREGFLSHEVPNLVYSAIGGERLWVGARLDYFLERQGGYISRENRSICIRLLAASSPEELADAPQVTFGHTWSSPECHVDVNACDFSPDFPPIFIPNESALYFQQGRLYFAFVCMTFKGRTPDFPSSFIAVFSTEPRGPIRTWEWRYDGKLATYKEAVALWGGAGPHPDRVVSGARWPFACLFYPGSMESGGGHGLRW